MSWLDSLADNASLENQLSNLEGAAIPEKGPGFLDGALTAFDQGLTKGVLKLGDTIGQGPGHARFGSEEGLSIEDFKNRKTEARANYAKIIQDLTPDPASVGLAGQVLNPLADVIPRAAVGAVLGGPIGSGLLAGIPEFTTSKTLAEAEGIDSSTATTKGIIDATVMGAGAMLPAARIFRNIGADFAATVGANVGLGVTGRGATSLLLEENGYETQAAQYQAFDSTAMIIDAVLGAAFFGLARVSSTGRAELSPETVDAALTQNQENHADMTGPGIPVDPQTTKVHQQSLQQALEQIANNEPVTITADMERAEFLRLPRGVRNNNPGNIRADGTPWQGMITGNDAAFATFESPEAGIRALAKNLLTYQDKHGLNTVMGIVQRWAPQTENNTQAYVNAVSKEMGVQPGDNLNLRDPDTLNKLTKAIIKHENGRNPYKDKTIARGVGKALGSIPSEGSANAVRRQLASRSDLTGDFKENLANLYERASTVKPDFDARIQQIVDEASITSRPIIPDGLKGVDRAVEKLMTEYGGDVTQLKDVVRATVVVDGLEQIPNTLQVTNSKFTDVVSIKDGLSNPDSMYSSPVGYRDLKVNVMMEGVPAEIQVNLPQMVKAQTKAHSMYEQVRSIEAKAYKENRDFTPQEIEQLTQLKAQQKEIYTRAWDDATSAANSDSGMSLPLWLNDDTGNFLPPSTSQARQSNVGVQDTGTPSTSASSVPAGNSVGSDNFISSVLESIADFITPNQRATDGIAEARPSTGQPADSMEMQTAIKAIEADPNMRVVLDDGREVSAVEALQIARDEMAQAQADSQAYDAAVTCLLRTE